MTKRLLGAVANIGFVFLLTVGIAAAPPAYAAELKIFVAEVVQPVIGELFSQFERSSGHKLNVQYGAAVAQIKQVQAGEPFDLVIFPITVIKGPDTAALFLPDPIVGIARAGQGVAVRAGSPKPNIGTADALKETLLKAQSVAFFPKGASGQQTLKLFERLGITEQMKAKIRPQEPEQVPTVVAKGEAELALFLTHLLVGAPGLEYVGPYPGDLQQYIAFTAAVGAKAQQPDAAKALIKHLTTPAAAAAIKAKGMEPG
jgi:molybdate transport system substrate-binding protein